MPTITITIDDSDAALQLAWDIAHLDSFDIRKAKLHFRGREPGPECDIREDQ